MQIIDKESVEEVKANREIPEIKPGYIIQLKVVLYFYWNKARYIVTEHNLKVSYVELS